MQEILPPTDGIKPPVSKTPNARQKPKRVIQQWILTKSLGQGSMGKVKLAINSVTKQKLACKIIPRPFDSLPFKDGKDIVGPTSSIKDIPFVEYSNIKSTQKDQIDDKRIIREASISLLLNHPNIVSMQEIIVDDYYYYMFFEYVEGGQLLDYIISHGMLNEKLARRFMRQIISAVDYCHQNSIVHRDLKIENILIDKEGVAKVIDFGLANVFSPYTLLSTFCGSLYFAAPELLSAKSYVGPEVDIWSLGIILFVLICGKVPFDDSTMPALHAKIKSGIYSPPTHVSEECIHLISRLLVVDPTKRASMAEIKQHPWILRIYEEPPESFIPPRPPLKLPLEINIIRKMKGFGFGTDGHIKAILETFIRSKRPQGTQKWVVGGRAMIGPESPVISIYYLAWEKFQREKSLNSAKYSSIRKPQVLWKSIFKNNSDSDDTSQQKINIGDTLKSLFRRPSKLESVLKDHKNLNYRPTYLDREVPITPRRSISSEKSQDFSIPLPRKSVSDMSKIEEFRSKYLNDNALKQSTLPIRKRSNTSTTRDENTKKVDLPKSMSENKFEKLLPGVPKQSFDSSTTLNNAKNSGFFAKIRSRIGIGYSKAKTQVDLKPTISKPKTTTIFSPSFAMLRAISSRIKLGRNRDIESDSPGISTSNIKTAQITGMFSIRNTTHLPPAAIRTELLRAFNRVSNMIASEKEGGFFCKYYSIDLSKELPNLARISQTNIKEKELPNLMFDFNFDKELPNSPIEIKCANSYPDSLDFVKPQVQFEVQIKKIPFSDLHGLQFTKISGDSWKVFNSYLLIILV